MPPTSLTPPPLRSNTPCFLQITAAALTLALITHHSHGAEPADGGSPNNTPKPLQTVEVVGEAPLETQRLEQATPMVGLDEADITQHPNPRLGDALKRLPGVTYGGDINENKDLQLRGLGKGFSRVQVGGVQIPDGGDQREFQLNRLPSSFVKKAEFLRNPTAEYESDGIGGRLALETIDIPESIGGDLRFSGGGRGSESPLWNTSAMLGGRPTGWLGLLGSANYYKDPTLKEKREVKYKSDGSVDGSSRQEEVKEIEAVDLYFDLGLFYDQGEIHIKPVYLNLESDKNSVENSADGRDIDYEKRTKRTEGLTVASIHRWSDHARQDSSVSFYKSFERTPLKGTDSYEADGGALAFTGSEFESQYKEDLTWDFQTKTTLNLDTPLRQEIKFGAAFRRKERENDLQLFERDEEGKAENITSPADGYHLTENYAAAFLQDQIWLTDKFSLLPGLRVEHVQLRSRDSESPTASSDLTDLNPALHALFQPTKKLSFHAAVSRTLNRPQFDQLSPFRDTEDDEITLGNPELDPARSWNIDLGADHQWNSAFLGINLFHKKITDVIERINTGVTDGDREIYQYENTGDGWLQGIELDQRLSFDWIHHPMLEGLKLWANQSLLRSRVHDESGEGESRRFVGQPTFVANVGLDYELKGSGTLFTVSANFVDKIDSTEPDGTRTTFAPEWCLNASVHQKLGHGLEMFVEAVNLTDETRVETEYKSSGSSTREWSRSGRTLLVGLHYAF